MTRSQTVALVLGVSAIFAVALVFDVGGEVGIWSGGAAPRYTLPAAAAIIGAFIGGASAAATSYLADQRRFKREDKYRDYSERRQAYTEFLTSWHGHEEAKTRTSRLGNVKNMKDLEELEKASLQLEEADLQLQRSFNALSLIAPDEVREAAANLMNSKEPDKEPGRFWKAARKDLD